MASIHPECMLGYQRDDELVNEAKAKLAYFKTNISIDIC